MKSNFSNAGTTENTKDVYFVHIPKTGGTTIERLFKKYNYFVGTYDNKFNYNKHDFCPFWHVPPKYNKNINFKNYITFCFIRDPLERVVSEVNFLQVKSDINKFIKDRLINEDNNFVEDCHFLPQSDYIYDIYGNRVENILNFKNFDNELINFIKKYNLNIKYSKDTDVHLVSMKLWKVSDLSDEVINLIKKYYSKDYLLIKSLNF